ncbi:hypothetical protein ACJZ2D_008705 [Fusarium nematophilum]
MDDPLPILCREGRPATLLIGLRALPAEQEQLADARASSHLATPTSRPLVDASRPARAGPSLFSLVSEKDTLGCDGPSSALDAGIPIPQTFEGSLAYDSARPAAKPPVVLCPFSSSISRGPL